MKNSKRTTRAIAASACTALAIFIAVAFGALMAPASQAPQGADADHRWSAPASSEGAYDSTSASPDSSAAASAQEAERFSAQQESHNRIANGDSASAGNLAPESLYAPNQLIASFDPSMDEAAIRALLADEGVNLTGMDLVSQPADGSAAVMKLTFEGAQDAAEVARTLSTNEQVVGAEPDYLKRLDAVDAAPTASSQDASTSNALVAPTTDLLSDLDSTVNDTYFSQQWALEAIGAPTAWNSARANGKVTVAVLDSGVNWNHPDLRDNLILGKYAKNMYTGLTGAAAVNDDIGHGTHVAGIIAGIANNGHGVAGVSYNARILPIKTTCDSEGNMYTSDIVKGIDYVVKLKKSSSSPASLKNIRVINLSLGSYDYSFYENAAVQRAVDAGILVVSAGGNESETAPHYPAAYPSVIGVSALKSSYFGGVSFDYSYSNHGSYIDIAAPGTNIYSTVPSGSYSTMSGTSMATPYVSGAAALVFAFNKNYTPSEVESILEHSAYDYGSSGWDEYYGFGALRIDSALSFAQTGDVDTGCAVLRPDGSVWRSTMKGKAIDRNWSDQAKNSVRTLFIAPGVRSITNRVTVDYPDSIANHFPALRTVKFRTNGKGLNACKKIGSQAFKDCDNLMDVVNLQKTRVKAICKESFESCSALVNITLPKTLVKIGDFAFYGAWFKAIPGISTSQLKRIGRGAFANCTALAKIDLPATTTKIGAYAFQNCGNLKTAVLRSSKVVDFKTQANGNSFLSTPLNENASNGAKLFVPRHLLGKYKAKARTGDYWKRHLAAIAGTRL